jgi:hypothetical protein
MKFMRSVPSAPIVGPFADRLLALDLPHLDPSRRSDTVRFVARRVDALPSVIHLGVLAIAAVSRVVVATPVADRFVRLMARLALPLVGEYVRLIRSLGYAYIWETWPDTLPDGATAWENAA